MIQLYASMANISHGAVYADNIYSSPSLGVLQSLLNIERVSTWQQNWRVLLERINLFNLR